MNAVTLEAPLRLSGLRVRVQEDTPATTLEQAHERLLAACALARADQAAASASSALRLVAGETACTSFWREIAALQSAAALAPAETQQWMLRRVDGSLVGLIRLRADGSVGVNMPPAQSRWSFAGGTLAIADAQGRTTARFTITGESGGHRAWIGLDADGGGALSLSEVDCRYAQMRLLEPELVAPFAGLIDPEQLSPAELPARPAVLLAAPRTGSHLLLNLLNSSGHVFFDAELLNPERISVFGADLRYDDSAALFLLRANDPVRFLKVMLARSHHVDGRRLDDIGVRGFKLFPQQSRRALDWVLAEPAMRIVHLHRANLLAEYSSALVAYAEGHWVGGPASLKTHQLPFQRARFLDFVALKRRYLDALRERLAARGDFVEIEYSAINHAGVNGVLSYLHGAPSNVGLSTLGIQRQLNAHVIDRFENPDDVRRCLDELGQPAWAEVERP